MTDPDLQRAPDPDDEPPWERTGAQRRDCEPHRGWLLHGLGIASVVCSFLTLCLWAPALVGVALGASVWVMAGRDLARMDAGAMDTSGRHTTQEARGWEQLGVLPGCAYLAVCSPIFWTLLLDKPWAGWGGDK